MDNTNKNINQNANTNENKKINNQRTAGKIKGQKLHKGIRKTGHKSCISK